MMQPEDGVPARSPRRRTGVRDRTRAATKEVLLGLRDSLWLVPLLCMIGGAGLCLLAAAIDQATGNTLVPRWVTGPPSAAQTVLSTIVTSLVTLITLVLTVITVAVQLAMGQFSPRIVRALLQDRYSQYTHGLFAATLVYALLAIPRVDDPTGYVPGLMMLLGYLLMLASIVALVLYVHHAGQTLRVAGLIDLVGDHLHEELNRAYPDDPTAGVNLDPRVIPAPTQGVVVHIDVPGLVAAAVAAGCALRLVPAMGDFVCAHAPLLLVDDGDVTRLDVTHVAGLVTLGDERSYPADAAYGFRQLVDIAERGVSDPFSDPTTTVQAIDRLHDALRQLATRAIPTGEHRDKLGARRLVIPVLDWTGYVRLTFDELRLAGAGSPQVARRLRAALEDLLGVVSGPRRQELSRQLELLTLGVQKSYDNDDDITNALIGDQQGLGSGPDMVQRQGVSAPQAAGDLQRRP